MSQKGFVLVVEELKGIIIEKQLKPGDKLPSERYLSDKLEISRSSIREALRAMELVGIITTKRGEGTFLSNIDEHQLFELIGSYLIQSDKQRNEIEEFINCIKLYQIQHGTENVIMRRVYKLLNHYNDAFNHKGDNDV